MKKNKILLLVSLMLGSTLLANEINAFKVNALEGDTYSLVTDASTLKVGDTIILANIDAKVSMCTSHNINNRVKVIVNINNNVISYVSTLQEITLGEGTKENTWSFDVGDGYLYAASSSSNNLKTEKTLTNNSSWEIVISNSNASIVAKGDNARNLLKYNSANGLFSCYASGQDEVSIFLKDSEKTLNEKFVDVKTNTNLKFNYTKRHSNLVTELIDFTKQNYENGEAISSYNGDNYDVKFNNNSNSNSPTYYSSGTAIRVYKNNSLTISSTNQNIKNIKLVLSAEYSDGVSKLILSSGVANTSEKNTILIQNTNDLSITIKNSGSSQLRIQQIIINEQEITYSNFNNLQIQYQYSFDVSSYTEVQEVGIFVTDDKKFNFYTDGTYDEETPFEIGLTTGTKGHRFVNSNKKETYTVGVNLGNDIEGAILTTLRASAYIKVDNKYYFSKNISEYNLQTMLEEYSKLTLEGEGNAIVDSFLSYVNSL